MQWEKSNKYFDFFLKLYVSNLYRLTLGHFKIFSYFSYKSSLAYKINIRCTIFHEKLYSESKSSIKMSKEVEALLTFNCAAIRYFGLSFHNQNDQSDLYCKNFYLKSRRLNFLHYLILEIDFYFEFVLILNQIRMK